MKKILIADDDDNMVHFSHAESSLVSNIFIYIFSFDTYNVVIAVALLLAPSPLYS